jgi:hypothetical protein
MRQRHVPTVFAASVAAAFVVTHAPKLTGSPMDLAAAVVNAVPDQVAMIAGVASSGGITQFTGLGEMVAGSNRGKPGRHLGFDTYAYPGDDVMRAWRRENTPYEWVGYYLPAPCHSGRTWVGKREQLSNMGWGMAVIYVGQQTWDRTPTGYETHYRTAKRTKYVSKRVKTSVVRNGKRVTRYVTKKVPVRTTVRLPVKVRVDPVKRDIHDCNAQLVNQTRGTMEAKDAIRRTEAEGFPRGSVIFLDIEYMKATPRKMREYYTAWTAHVLADGRYRPGFYAHTHNAALIYKDVKAAYASAGRTDEPPFWIAGGSDFSPDKAPHEVGHSFAAVWQGLLDVVEEWNGHRLPIDVNVAHVPNPSFQFLTTD